MKIKEQIQTNNSLWTADPFLSKGKRHYIVETISRETGLRVGYNTYTLKEWIDRKKHLIKYFNGKEMHKGGKR